MEKPCMLDPRFRMIKEGRLFDLMAMWRIDFLSAHARDLLFRLLQVDPRARPCMEEIQGHPWLQQEQQQQPGEEPLVMGGGTAPAT
jgi:hypothetical protein